MMVHEPDLFNNRADKTTRHWSPQSEQYASGDALLQALDDGWQVKGVIFRQEVWLAGGRRTYVYHVELERDGETIKMKMVHNPFITRLIYRFNVQVVRLNERKGTQRERW
jgi:hypothetical protein